MEQYFVHNFTKVKQVGVKVGFLIFLFVALFSKLHSQSVYIKVENKCNEIRVFYYNDSLSKSSMLYTKDTLDSFSYTQNSISSIETFTLSGRPMSSMFIIQPGDSLAVQINAQFVVSYKLLNQGEFYRLRELEIQKFNPGIEKEYSIQIEKALKENNIKKAESINALGFLKHKESLTQFYANHLNEPLVKKKLKALEVEQESMSIWCQSRLNLLSSPIIYKAALERFLFAANDAQLLDFSVIQNAILFVVNKAQKTDPVNFSSEYFFDLIEKKLAPSIVKRNLLFTIVKQSGTLKMFDTLTKKYLANNYSIETEQRLSEHRIFKYTPDSNSTHSIVFTKEKKPLSFDSLIHSFKGKYIYIDIWASWCAPCVAEMPASYRLAKKYGNDIAFIYLSIDDTYENWLTSRVSKEFLNQHRDSYILSGKSFNYQDYNIRIQGVPRYIFIDKNGKILNADAPRPGDPQIEKLFSKTI